MTEDPLLPFDLPAIGRKKVTADFAGGSISSDGGLVLLRAAEHRLGLAGCIREWRDPARAVYTLPAMLRFRMFAIGLRISLSPGRRSRARGRMPTTETRCTACPANWRGATGKPSPFNAHCDTRCFLPVHVYHVESGKPMAVLPRPGKTPRVQNQPINDASREQVRLYQSRDRQCEPHRQRIGRPRRPADSSLPRSCLHDSAPALYPTPPWKALGKAGVPEETLAEVAGRDPFYFIPLRGYDIRVSARQKLWQELRQPFIQPCGPSDKVLLVRFHDISGSSALPHPLHERSRRVL